MLGIYLKPATDRIRQRRTQETRNEKSADSTGGDKQDPPSRSVHLRDLSIGSAIEPEGSARLTARGLPQRFPAVVRNGHPPAASLYFAGDFSDNPMADNRVPFVGYLTFKRRIEAVKLSPSESGFYWTFYVPVMDNLLSELN